MPEYVGRVSQHFDAVGQVDYGGVVFTVAGLYRQEYHSGEVLEEAKLAGRYMGSRLFTFTLLVKATPMHW